jgi:hypothetical protein
LGATQKTNTAVHSGVINNCQNCHKSTSTWTSSKPDHSLYTTATNCSTCHNGTTAPGKSSTHIPTGTANCFACHNPTLAIWTPTKWNHTQVTVTNACASCHTGGYPPADGRPNNHIPYASVAVAAAANCDGCHKSGYTAWNPGYFHRNYSVTTGCATCHMTLTYLGPTQAKPNTATHNGVTVCETCHKSTTAWLTGVTYTHSAANAVGTGTCDTCHNGATALGKTATHIPIPAGSAKCDSCHKSQVSFATAVTMNHTVVTTAQCKSCHNGSYTSQGVTGALGKPTNHIPEGTQLLNGTLLDCNACHSSTAAFTTERMNHNSTQGNGAGWCKGCHERSTAFLGNMQKMALNHRNKTPAPTDCSQSGCHRPLGNTGTAYSNWN